jgi:hypothetical protein
VSSCTPCIYPAYFVRGIAIRCGVHVRRALKTEEGCAEGKDGLSFFSLASTEYEQPSYYLVLFRLFYEAVVSSAFQFTALHSSSRLMGSRWVSLMGNEMEGNAAAGQTKKIQEIGKPGNPDALIDVVNLLGGAITARPRNRPYRPRPVAATKVLVCDVGLLWLSSPFGPFFNANDLQRPPPPTTRYRDQVELTGSSHLVKPVCCLRWPCELALVVVSRRLCYCSPIQLLLAHRYRLLDDRRQGRSQLLVFEGRLPLILFLWLSFINCRHSRLCPSPSTAEWPVPAGDR